MSSSDTNAAMQQGAHRVQCENIPQWINYFLQKTFFSKCQIHDKQKNNDVNRYCIQCDLPNCKDCMANSVHNGHQILTIYRHVYQDAVPLNEMKVHLDCSRIQPYKCNGKLVLSMKPLPHNGSGSLIEGNKSCNVCKRKLTNPVQYHFCSIICKVEAFYGGTLPVVVKSFRKRSRKGIPHRSSSLGCQIAERSSNI